MHAPPVTVASPAHADHAILPGMADGDAVRVFLELARANTLARANSMPDEQIDPDSSRDELECTSEEHIK